MPPKRRISYAGRLMTDKRSGESLGELQLGGWWCWQNEEALPIFWEI